MTTLSTHDTKRSEDVRARLVTLSEVPEAWRAAVTEWQQAAAPYRSAAGWPDPETEYLLWQTLVGTWPISAARLTEYLLKASREAKRHTTWTDQNSDYEQALTAFATSVLADDTIAASVAAFVDSLRPWADVATLTTKLLALTLPGVPDVYQGTELIDLSLVDPDNRRPVDFTERAGRLAGLDEGAASVDDVAQRKLLVVSRALRLRRDEPGWFDAEAGYEPLPTTTNHALGFVRAGAVAIVVTRRPRALAETGGWGDARVVLPTGRWTDVLSGRSIDGGSVMLADLFARLPVSLLVKGPA
jgi:(1->4)-alpha-D-glucan 1-alpha-D-glucosylmutase